MKRAVFLDRDGVLVEDVHLLTRPDQLRVLAGVPEALRRLADAGYELLVVTNQTVVARGLSTEQEVRQVHSQLAAELERAGAPHLKSFYVCPHHPNATLLRYRVVCECRKPRPGLLLAAARDLSIELSTSFMIGDRPSDILAGMKAGCRTIQLTTGLHGSAMIESTDAPAEPARPDHVCGGLGQAADWILQLK